MTPNEHAVNIFGKLRRAEAALRALHKALADSVTEHGDAIGLESDITTAAVAPKDPPPDS